MKSFRLGIWTLFTLAFLYTAINLVGNNQEPLSVEIFDYVTPIRPKWMILLSSVFIGGILSSFFFLFEIIVLESRNIRLRRTVQKLERALTAVKGNAPAAASAMPVVRPLSGPSAVDESDV